MTDAARTRTDAAIALYLGNLGTDNRPALALINRPTLIVATKDKWVRDVLGAGYMDMEDMQKRITGARLVFFEGAGHALFVDDADRFNSLLEDFVKGLR